MVGWNPDDDLFHFEIFYKNHGILDVISRNGKKYVQIFLHDGREEEVPYDDLMEVLLKAKNAHLE